MNKTTIFKQLIIKVLVPVTLVLIFLAYKVMDDKKNDLKEEHHKSNMFVADKIQLILEDQDEMLSIIEENLNNRVRSLVTQLVYQKFIITDGIENVDLNQVKDDLDMDHHEDIYIIDRNGVIVNSSYEKDLGLNTYETFGEGFQRYLEGIFDSKKFTTENFSPEKATNTLKKYAYQPTLDGQYMIEIGVESFDANRVTDHASQNLNNICSKDVNSLPNDNENILSIDLFIGKENPVSINNKDAKISPNHLNKYRSVLESGYNVLKHKDETSDILHTRDTIEYIDGKKIHYQYTYMPRKNSVLYENSVIRIISDRSSEDVIIQNALKSISIFFGATIILLVILVLFVAKGITNPLNQLMHTVNKVSEGIFNERAEKKGSKEIRNLALNFNHMLDELEVLYHNLEQKVKERTAEIMQQKEEIESQRDQIEHQRDNLMTTNRNLEKAYKEIEEQKSNIEDSIHYAKRIQTAILPTHEDLNQIAGNHFILYKPKDIVSGDFYWATEKDGLSIIAVADCTGHGVPGAFMSMIGNTLLNKIVNENNTSDAGEILNNLRNGVINSLKQTGGDFESKDGMDITIITFDKKKKKLDFAGANNPLYIVRDNELIVTRGDKQPVGYFIGKMSPFKKKTIPLKKGDKIYLFTDGYQDQFGGDYDKKFMVKNYKKLLVDISEKDLQTQKEVLNNTIENWMVNTSQIDDILILGIEV